MPGPASTVQQRSRTAPNIEHRPGVHDQIKVEVIASQIDAAGGQVKAVAIYEHGQYQVWVPAHGTPLQAKATAGMYVLTKTPATWTPH